MRTRLLDYWQDFWYLFYPKVCDTCGKSLMHQEEILCTECLVNIPKTAYHHDKENELAEIFWGRVKLENVTALIHFVKGSKYRKLIHKLKYKNRPEIGVYMGRELGAELNESEDFSKIDFIVPVPLHPDRQKQRGYNQAEMIANGISEVTEIPVDADNLYRAVSTSTQTKKGRYERWENVSGIFQMRDKDIFRNKHILLVDDVITTGSTIEAAAQGILTAENSKVSIASIGVATS